MAKCMSTLEVIRDYIMYRLNESDSCREAQAKAQTNKCDCRYSTQDSCNKIRAYAIEAETTNKKTFDSFINEILDNNSLECYEIIQKLQEVADGLFQDQCINWGRLVALISFIAYFAYRYVVQMQDIEVAGVFTCKLLEWFTSYITCKAGMWIECNGGWVKLLQ